MIAIVGMRSAGVQAGREATRAKCSAPISESIDRPAAPTRVAAVSHNGLRVSERFVSDTTEGPLQWHVPDGMLDAMVALAGEATTSHPADHAAATCEDRAAPGRAQPAQAAVLYRTRPGAQDRTHGGARSGRAARTRSTGWGTPRVLAGAMRR